MYVEVPPDTTTPLVSPGALRLEKSFRLLAFKVVLAMLPPESLASPVT